LEAVVLETVRIGGWPVVVSAADDVPEIVRERGGALFVWASVHGLWRGRIVLLEAETTCPPRLDLRFERVDLEAFELYVDLRGFRVPELLVFETTRRRKQIRAYWNDQAMVGW
jgi:hypothetical protein